MPLLADHRTYPSILNVCFLRLFRHISRLLLDLHNQLSDDYRDTVKPYIDRFIQTGDLYY